MTTSNDQYQGALQRYGETAFQVIEQRAGVERLRAEGRSTAAAESQLESLEASLAEIGQEVLGLGRPSVILRLDEPLAGGCARG